MIKKIYSGKWGKCHCQGFAVDKERKFVYYSFTTKLIKADMQGNIVGSVDNILGHLGCIDYCDQDGKLYCSLEYKNDEIGRGILRSLGYDEKNLQDGFYIAMFDVEKIDHIGMNAETDGVMRAVYLPTVATDFAGTTKNGTAHIHGCSGIDGITIGRDFGGEENYLCVCYGVYRDESRKDNDYQVILQYDYRDFWEIGKPLSQNDMHKVGPSEPRNKFFVYTGNTTYGIQNLEYDEATGNYFVFVYNGTKPQFPNYSTFVIDGKVAPKTELLKGYDGETGKVLSLVECGETVSGVSGFNCAYGSMGAYSLGNGKFYLIVPEENFDPNDWAVNATLFRLDKSNKVWNFIED